MIDCSLYILISFLVSMLLGLGMIPLVVSFCKVKRIYDLPNERKVHKVFVPRLGGVCFIPCVVISFMLATAIVSRISEGTSLSLSLWTCYFSVGLLAIYVAGVVDDIVGVSPRTKFLVQIFAASILPLSGLYINNLYGFCGIGEIPLWVGAMLTVIVIVFIDNAINLIDGIDGLAAFLAIIALFGFFVLFLSEDLLSYCIIIAGLLGVLVAFVRFNLFGKQGKNKIFMGDSGSLTLGFILGTLFVKCSMVRVNAEPAVVGGMPIVSSYLIVPVFDVCRVIITRFVHHRPIFMADKNHIHHKLLRTGMTQHQALGVLVVMALLFILINLLIGKNIGFTMIIVLDILVWVALQQLLDVFIRRNGKKVFV